MTQQIARLGGSICEFKLAGTGAGFGRGRFSSVRAQGVGRCPILAPRGMISANRAYKRWGRFLLACGEYRLALAGHPIYVARRRAQIARQSAQGARALDGLTHGAAEFVIRPGDETDLDAVFALECASFRTDRLSRRALRQFLRASHRPLLVARSVGRVIGYVLIAMRVHSKSARIYSLAVDAEVARRGIGRELLHAAERYARAHGRGSLRLEVRYDNSSAINLYQKLGYHNFGHYPGYYADGATALRFEKSLNPRAGDQS